MLLRLGERRGGERGKERGGGRTGREGGREGEEEPGHYQDEEEGTKDAVVVYYYVGRLLCT